MSFLSEEEDGRFLDQSSAHGVEGVELARAAHSINQAALRAREKYCSFIAGWPEAYRRGGRNFKEAFTHRGEVAYWWLTSASMKDNEASPTFEYLCHLEVIKESLGLGAGRCILIGDDPMTALLTGRACAALDVPFQAPGVGSLRLRPWALRGLASRLWLVGKLLAMLVVFRVFFRPRSSDAGPVVGFFTLYPTLLRLDNGVLADRNYREFPKYVAQHSDGGAVYVASFNPGSWGDWRLLWRQRRALRGQGEPRLLFLESYLRFSDLALVMVNLLFVLRYTWLERVDRDFRQSFSYDGINIHELVGPELSRNLLGNQLPSYLVLALLVQRATRANPMSHLVCFLELYATGRAVYYGAKKGRPQLVTVAYQHANISRMKLWYSYKPAEVVSPDGEVGFVATMPVPDRYLFQGENGRRVIMESGYPPERCHVTGSPRYDALGNTLRTGDRLGRPSHDDPSRKILVVPALSERDGVEMLEACAIACAGSSLRPRILVKPYPSSSIGERITEVRDSTGYEDIEVVQGDLYQLIGDAHVVVTSYSTVGDEAIALGCPVVCYAGVRPTMSSFPDIPAAPVVHDAGGLRAALEGMFNDPGYLETYKAHWPALIEGSFYRLDGGACHRMFEAMMGREVPESAAGGSHERGESRVGG